VCGDHLFADIADTSVLTYVLTSLLTSSLTPLAEQAWLPISKRLVDEACRLVCGDHLFADIGAAEPHNLSGT